MKFYRISLPVMLTGLFILFSLFITPNSARAVSANQIDSLEAIKLKGSLVVGMDIPYGIMEFYDENGRAAGIDVDIARELSNQLGVNLEIKAMPFDKLFSAVINKEVDIVASAVTITRDRQKTLLFSEPYLDAGMSLAVRSDNTLIKSHDDLAGKKIGVLKGTVGDALAQKSELFRDSDVIRFQDNEKRLQALQDGAIDAAIVHFLVSEEASIRLVGEPLKQTFYGIVTRPGNESLMAVVNKSLRQMKRRRELRAIIQKYKASQ